MTCTCSHPHTQTHTRTRTHTHTHPHTRTHTLTHTCTCTNRQRTSRVTDSASNVAAHRGAARRLHLARCLIAGRGATVQPRAPRGPVYRWAASLSPYQVVACVVLVMPMISFSVSCPAIAARSQPACLTTPIETALLWIFVTRRNHLLPRLTEDMLQHIPGLCACACVEDVIHTPSQPPERPVK
jgi:hypothetical protein